ncbi:A disintegrin and metalloproteinase with thrombospondin motifs 9-like [Portunus trituberculatus]|uniref:A disintegrin and metalloproteinase with thrombospondin motifs 9-like n=1 Tax=Portunus trituberculatus TaxID=210409 RepID=UPI001E1D03F9|nr:A disintegrin and metalloproteinase with thrombospondin motifs 9-like [Portunus trituberculatus]
MTEYHGSQLDQYILTLMSVVALIFRDVSVGHRLDISVVEILKEKTQFYSKKKYVTDNNSEVPGRSAEEMLKTFCKWQQHSLKRHSTHPRRYDTALLLTRENICRNPWTKSCDTLGLAELGTMCSRHSSCAIVQDNGLSAAFTIAHELGHLLNMPHDNDDKCALLSVGSLKGAAKEEARQQPTMNVMSRMLDHNTLPWEWSDCSRRYLTEYLHGGHGVCLQDDPSTNRLIDREFEYTLAGELFNATRQCQYVFGHSSKICPYMPPCKRLWCTTSEDEKEGCRTQHMPWADGTECGYEKWCLKGRCVNRDRAITRKIHGHWGSWLPWSDCSRTCGVGVRSSTRRCDSPAPKYGGNYCTGERVKYESCIGQPCPVGAIDFRTQQCHAFNNKNFGLTDIPEDVVWVPKYTGISREDSCQLFCQVSNRPPTAYYKLRDKVKDGTLCGPGTFDICVTGECRRAGCDFILNSNATADVCGVCRGDNSTCEVTSGVFDESFPYGYSNVVELPEGAAMVEVTQRAYHGLATDDNYLAIVDPETGEYLLNGGSVVTPFSKLVAIGSTLLQYSGSSATTERLNATDPLEKKLLVQILSVGDLNPPYINFSYIKSTLHHDPNYYWKLDDWTECSDSCDGERERVAFCVRTGDGVRVRESYVPPTTDSLHSASPVPPPARSTGSTQIGQRSDTVGVECEVRGDGECVRRREMVGCITSRRVSVAPHLCPPEDKYEEDVCGPHECPAWVYPDDWAPCKCAAGEGVGVQHRLYSCTLRQRAVPLWACAGLKEPTHVQNCSCWVEGEWGEGGKQHPRGRGRHWKHPTTAPPTRSPWTWHAPDPHAPRGGEETNEIPTGEEGGWGAQFPPPNTPYHPPPPHHSSEEESNNEVGDYRPPLTPSTTQQPPPHHHHHHHHHHHRHQTPGAWQTGGWSDCSQECGGGEKRRQVVCASRGPDGSGAPTVCPAEERPADTAPCNTHGCPEWSTGDWGRCRLRHASRGCGRGEEERLVVCRDPYGPTLGEGRCHAPDRPTSSRPCKIPCRRGRGRGRRPGRPHKSHRYKWKAGKWSRCSESCGRGIKLRNVSCVDTYMNGQRVHYEYCVRQGLAHRKFTRRCNVQACPWQWLAAPWSKCSEQCGPGWETRAVTCHAVNYLSWIDPLPSDPSSCPAKTKPRAQRRCKLGECGAPYLWRTKAWKPCQAVCGRRGRQRRSVVCVTRAGERAARHLCPRESRPRRKQRCAGAPCGFTSCAQVRASLGSGGGADGEYTLLVGGRNMSIYCHDMNSTQKAPLEYLTLPTGEEGNFAEIYDKILIQPSTCPHGGERRRDCACVEDRSHKGYTVFTKIRLNVTTLTVDAYDFTYARAVGGRLVSYGEAGDCFSMASCPQGEFSINLSGTLLAVSPHTRWEAEGSHASHRIKRLDDNQRVLGRCGGYCGTCSPHPSSGLRLSVANLEPL